MVSSLRAVGSSRTGAGTVVAVGAMAAIMRAHTLTNILAFIMAKSRNGTINFTIRHTHVAWPTTGGFRPISVTPSLTAHSVAREICRCLDAFDMAYWGPFFEVQRALTHFESTLNHERFLVNLTITD